MLDKIQITSLFDKLGTPPAGRRLILDARVNAPVRQVQSRGGNVMTYLASKKMARDIRTESNHLEFAAAYTKEHAVDVIEYYAQPCELKLTLVNDAASGARTVPHTPDFLTIRDDGFTLEELKSEEKLTRLAEKYPYRYSKGADGQWRATQIEEQLAELGIRYRITSDAMIPRRFVSNLINLADYLQAAISVPEDVVTRLQDALQEHGFLSFSDLLNAPFMFHADSLNQAIADQRVATDLYRESLADKRCFHLYRDEVLRDFLLMTSPSSGLPGFDSFVFNVAEGTKFAFESQELTMVLVAEESIVCSRQDGSNIQLDRSWLEDAHEKGQIKILEQNEQPDDNVSSYSKEELEQALNRNKILNAGSTEIDVSSRTLRRWAARRSVALANGANEILALVPNVRGRGNRTRRLSELQVQLTDKVIDEHWVDSKAINYRTCHRILKDVCAKAGEKAPSYPTLIQRIKNRENTKSVRIRLGKRYAYQQDVFVDVLYHDTPVHGSRPFMYVHIDHTQLDIEVLSSRTGKPLGRPWLTLAVDAWSRRILAFYLTFDSPSYKSVMMTLRDLVRRFSRLPDFIIVDNGSDFISDAFRTFLEVMGTHLRFRPAGHPRYGSVLERMFGRVHTEYVHNLAGNTKATKNVRMITGSHLPEKLAEWTLKALYYGIKHWAYEYYDQEMHPVLNESPKDAFMRGVREHGTRPQRYIQFNRDFLIATCPPVDRVGTRLIDRQRGVKVDHRFYWNDEFRLAQHSGQSQPVREDLWDGSSVYVWLKDKWVRAVCRALHGFGLLSNIEKRALTAEYKHRHKPSDNDPHAEQRLREFLQVFTPKGALATEFDRQAENKALYEALHLASVEPDAAPRRAKHFDQAPGAADTPAPPHRQSTPRREAPSREALPDFEDL
ncbi:DDE-type integrase/transposase/recombinase [Burkholderia cepacia]|uniref:DDE-type integrase/transposase/recombinase n=1 Tax=Burkholderia cepacia TaxID=292 RepID=UPI00075AA988|nr:DDE-type integrase/transposase/recombinase [Burkholderia cepacia]KVU49991.1 integrase [Burkholderia cepacia]